MTNSTRSRCVLAAMLLLRGAVHAAFAFWLLIARPAWVDVFRIWSSYALVDGVLGLIAMTAWLVARVRGGHSWSIDADELFDPLADAALISLVIGAMLFVSPPSSATELRVLATSASAGLAIVFLVASVGAVARRSPTIAHA